MLYRIFLILSILLNIYLLYVLILFRKGAGYITDVLADIRNSWFSRRIHIGSRFLSLDKLSTELNLLMDRFQNIMEEKEKLEVSHKQLISNISHDIRTPLTSLLGFVEVLQNNGALDSRERKEYLDIIHSKGLILYKMIQEFFELSRLESDDMEILVERTDLPEVVREEVASFYHEFAANHIAPVLSIPDMPLYVSGNDYCLRRILQNLISNVVKYGKDGGVIGIAVREETDRVWVDIWDKGKGIPGHDMPHLFNRLYVRESSGNGKIHGSGLGLVITKQLLEKLNGEITVSSEPNSRTTFSFSLKKYSGSSN